MTDISDSDLFLLMVPKAIPNKIAKNSTFKLLPVVKAEKIFYGIKFAMKVLEKLGFSLATNGS